jgi:ribosomal protein S18 acetylase RimI-like enzyme
MTNFQIKRVTPNDLDELQTISRITFHETFAGDNSPEDMNKYLDEEFSAGKLNKELKDRNTQFYFATLKNKIIGYLKINFGPSQTELQNENAVEIERIYVLKAYHGKNPGQLLYQKALEIALQKEVDFIWLGVWEHNLRAIHFYKKNGFVAFDKHLFKLGDDDQTDIMMKLSLDHKTGSVNSDNSRS